MGEVLVAALALYGAQQLYNYQYSTTLHTPRRRTQQAVLFAAAAGHGDVKQ
jgi:hypothetical protein